MGRELRQSAQGGRNTDFLKLSMQSLAILIVEAREVFLYSLSKTSAPFLLATDKDRPIS